MRRSASILALVLGLVGCQHAPLDTAKIYSARGDDLLAVEYLVYAIDEEPENEELRAEAALVLERARWQLRNDLAKLSEARSPGAVIAKWRTLQDLSLLSISYGFASDVLETDRMSEEADARAKILEATQEILDARLARGQPQSADLRLCREVASLDQESRPLTRTCDRLSQELMMIAAIAVEQVRGTPLNVGRIENLVSAKRFELFRVARAESPTPNVAWKIEVESAEVDEQDWHIVDRRPVRSWVERRDAEGNLVKRTVTQYPTEQELSDAEAKGLPAPQPKQVEKQVWDEVSGEYFFFQKFRELRLPYQSELTDLRTSRTIYGHHGVAMANSTRDYFQFRGDPRARVREFETVPEGRRMVQSLESEELLFNRALASAERQLVEELAGKVE